MKDDLKRLLNEFLEESVWYRTEKVEVQNTQSSPKEYKTIVNRPTVDDLIEWLNGRIKLEE